MSKLKRKTNLNQREWYKNGFAKLIGGVEVTKEEQQQNLELIKNAIDKNMSGEEMFIETEVFAKSYPNSLIYIKDYFDSLYQIKLKNVIGYYNHLSMTKENAIKTWEPQINHYKKLAIMIYAPIFINANKEEIKKYLEILGINLTELSSILNHYKLINATWIRNKAIKELKDENIDYKLAGYLALEILENNLTKQTICETYKISDKAFDNLIELLKETDISIYNQVNEKLNNNNNNNLEQLNLLVDKMAYYLKNGIQTENYKLGFTMLDYYTLTKINPINLLKEINKAKYTSREDLMKRRLILNFIEKYKDVGIFVSTKQVLNRNISFIIKENRIDITKEISDEVLEILDKAKIPNNSDIVYSALQRYARGVPILPLLEENKKIYKK